MMLQKQSRHVRIAGQTYIRSHLGESPFETNNQVGVEYIQENGSQPPVDKPPMSKFMLNVAWLAIFGSLLSFFNQ